MVLYLGYKVHLPDAFNNETGAKISYDELTWRSDDPGVIQITDGNVATTQSEGSTYLTAEWNGYTARCLVDIAERSNTISLDHTGRTCSVGSEWMVTLYNYSLEPFGEGYTVEWSVSDPSILSFEPTMNEDGEYAAMVYPLALGDAYLTCTVTWPDGTVRKDYSNFTVTSD